MVVEKPLFLISDTGVCVTEGTSTEDIQIWETQVKQIKAGVSQSSFCLAQNCSYQQESQYNKCVFLISIHHARRTPSNAREVREEARNNLVN